MKYELYKLKGNKILKEGHTMFLEDVVKDLNSWRNNALISGEGDKNE